VLKFGLKFTETTLGRLTIGLTYQVEGGSINDSQVIVTDMVIPYREATTTTVLMSARLRRKFEIALRREVCYVRPIPGGQTNLEVLTNPIIVTYPPMDENSGVINYNYGIKFFQELNVNPKPEDQYFKYYS
jgi:hypothetical protein